MPARLQVLAHWPATVEGILPGHRGDDEHSGGHDNVAHWREGEPRAVLNGVTVIDTHGSPLSSVRPDVFPAVGQESRWAFAAH
jgi:hypothetical protein